MLDEVFFLNIYIIFLDYLVLLNLFYKTDKEC